MVFRRKNYAIPGSEHGTFTHTIKERKAQIKISTLAFFSLKISYPGVLLFLLGNVTVVRKMMVIVWMSFMIMMKVQEQAYVQLPVDTMHS